MYSSSWRVRTRPDRLGAPTARSGRRRTRLTLLVAGVLAALACSAAPAGAQIVTDQSTHRQFGIVPAIGTHHTSSFACLAYSGDCSALTYHGGAVMHAERFYQLFWTPAGHAVPAGYEPGLNTFLNTMAAYDYTTYTMFSVDQQFYDLTGSAKRFVPYALSNGGQLIDTNPYPISGCADDGMTTCLTDAQLQSELTKYIAAHKLPVGPTNEYFIFTPRGVGSCFSSSSVPTNCAYTGYCGYHSFIGSANSSTEVLYANMPWAVGVRGCDTNIAFNSGYPNGAASGIDPVVGVWSHEASETMTDPNLNAWYQNGGADHGYENGDKCAYVYGSGGYGSTTGLPKNSTGYYNYALLGHQYLAQLEWDQRLLNCSKTDTDKQPTATITPTKASHGHATVFTAHVTAANGLNTIRWSFGDGTTLTTTTSSVSHAYATAGTKTMVAIVVDGHGNEKRVVQTISVS